METKKPKLKVKFKKKKLPETPAPQASQKVSQDLLDMLKALSTWMPKSDKAVLEAATRLAQAAREKIDYPEEPSKVDPFDKVFELVCHTLTRYDGISDSHDYILSVEASDDRTELAISSLHLFRRNRIGEPAISHRLLHFNARELLSDVQDAKSRIHRRRPFCPFPGYTLDTQEAMLAYRDVLPTILSFAGKVKLGGSRKRNVRCGK